MTNIEIIANTSSIETYQREIKYIKEVLFLEIQRSIKTAELEYSSLIEQFSNKFYEEIIDTIKILLQHCLYYENSIENIKVVFEEALKLENEITIDIQNSGVAIQNTYDEVQNLINIINQEIKYLTKKKGLEYEKFDY